MGFLSGISYTLLENASYHRSLRSALFSQGNSLTGGTSHEKTDSHRRDHYHPLRRNLHLSQRSNSDPRWRRRRAELPATDLWSRTERKIAGLVTIDILIATAEEGTLCGSNAL
jgi:hypothetical protein